MIKEIQIDIYFIVLFKTVSLNLYKFRIHLILILSVYVFIQSWSHKINLPFTVNDTSKCSTMIKEQICEECTGDNRGR